MSQNTSFHSVSFFYFKPTTTCGKLLQYLDMDYAALFMFTFLKGFSKRIETIFTYMYLLFVIFLCPVLIVPVRNTPSGIAYFCNTVDMSFLAKTCPPFISEYETFTFYGFL